MPKPHLELCEEILKQLKNKNSHRSPFLSILKTTILTQNSSKKLFTLKLPSYLYKERVEKKYLHLFKKEISLVYGTDFSFEIIVSSKNKKGEFLKPSFLQQKKHPVTELKRYTFNPRYTLKSFISGSSNTYLPKFFKELSSNPFKHSSVFIYGDTGFGKTHLLQALSQEISKKHPQVQIRYLSGEKFLQDCVSSIRLGQIETFQQDYRNNCQVLILDDFQEIEKGNKSQEEFFHAFNSIVERGGLVVCSGDRAPNSIRKIQTRIQTRLCGGVVFKISPPDLKTRSEILKTKAHTRKIQLTPCALRFIAQESEKISVREMEGWLNKIKMVCDLSSGKPSLEVVQSVLSTHISPFSQTPEGFIQNLARKNGVTVERLISSSRAQEIVVVRNQAMALLREKFPYLSLTQIGNLFGRRRHSTVLNALKKARTYKKTIYK